MTVKEIIRLHLISHGYDGLYNEGSCACLGEDLAPCDEMRPDCEVGFKIPCDCGDHDFHISAEKEKQITPINRLVGGDECEEDAPLGIDGVEVYLGPLPESLNRCNGKND